MSSYSTRSNTSGSSRYLFILAVSVAIPFFFAMRDSNQPRFSHGHPHAYVVRHVRNQLEGGHKYNIETLGQEDFAREDLMAAYEATCTQKHDGPQLCNSPFLIQSDGLLSNLKATFRLQTGKMIQKRIWITDLQYPTQQENTCLTFEFEDLNGQRSDASVREKCKDLYRLILRWFESDRDSIKKTPTDDPHYKLGSREYGVSFLTTNPSHFGMYYYTTYPEETVARYPLTNVSFENGIIKGQRLDQNLELSEVTFDAWKPRLNLAMEKYIEHVNTQEHAYYINQVIKVESSKAKLDPNREMTRKVLMTWEPKEKIFEVETEDMKLLGTIEKQSEIEVVKQEGEEGGKEFAHSCMKFKLKSGLDSDDYHEFYVDSDCELFYFDYLKLSV